MEEINALQKIQDLDNKRKHNPGTNSISTRSDIEMTNATKGIIERIARDLIEDNPSDELKTFVKQLNPTRSYKDFEKKTAQEEIAY